MTTRKMAGREERESRGKGIRNGSAKTARRSEFSVNAKGAGMSRREGDVPDEGGCQEEATAPKHHLRFECRVYSRNLWGLQS